MGWVSSGRVSREDFGLGVGVVRLPVWLGGRLLCEVVSRLAVGRRGRALMLKKANVKFVNGRQSHLVNITSTSYSRHVW